MIVNAFTKVLPVCLAAVLTVAAAAQATEQVETGQLTTQTGTRINYKIRLLPLASFPGIPDTIRTELETRHCMVPQTYEARQPENVVHGAFEKKGTSDWAVLCSVNGASSLLVFFANRSQTPFTLDTGKNSQWIAVRPSGQVRGFAWGVDALGPAEISQQVHADPDAFDHDGVGDAFIERESTIRYYSNGAWTILSPQN